MWTFYFLLAHCHLRTHSKLLSKILLIHSKYMAHNIWIWFRILWDKDRIGLYNLWHSRQVLIEFAQFHFCPVIWVEVYKEVNIQAGLIGGTMGFLTGFSIISGIAIILFVFRAIASLKTNWAAIEILEIFSDKQHQSQNITNWRRKKRFTFKAIYI